MKNILLIGVGGTGSSAVDALYYKLREMGNNADNKVTALVFDTDIGSISGISEAKSISMADTAGVGTVCDRLGADAVSDWFPYDVPSVRAQDLTYGASQWRKKSYLAFLNAMNKQASYSTFVRALEEVGQDPGETCEIYVIASIAGGTGSGSFIPIALFAKRFLREKMNRDPIVNAMIALPEIYEESQSPDNRVKIYANAYAILRELNAINLVARGYNREIRDGIDGEGKSKKAPIRFTIGSPLIRNVGVLFDASNPDYWTPDAAPFNQVFMLDRMPCVHSIHAHDIILANSMYAIIGTQMGARFQSVQNNSATLLSQNNGSNAIYAGISTAELRFPREAILSYLAHEKAYRSCEDEWLLLHRATEDTIREKEELARESKTRFFTGDGVYASLFLNELKNQYTTPTGNVTELVDRTTAIYDEEGRKTAATTVDAYYDRLIAAISSRLDSNSTTSGDDILSMIAGMRIDKCPSFFERIFGKSALRNVVAENAEMLADAFTGYFGAAVEFIRNSTTSVTEAVLTFKKEKDPLANTELSLISNILMKDGKYIHPVAAMVQLCRFKSKLLAFLQPKKKFEWAALKNGSAEKLPAGVFQAGGVAEGSKLKAMKSAYVKYGAERFNKLCHSTDEYRAARTDPYTDNAYLLKDATFSFEAFRRQTREQFIYAVFVRLSRYVDGLIDKYRDFFRRFEDARQDLAEAVKTAKRRDAGRVDSVLNVYSTEAEKERILHNVLGSAVEDEREIAENEHITGESVFSLCYNQLAAEVTSDISRMESMAMSFSSLFDGMVKNYEKTIRATSGFKELDKLDVFRALWNSSLLKNENPENTLREYLTKALDIAKPSLVVDTRPKKDDAVQPHEILVAMMSRNTAHRLKLDADRYGITVMANGATEQVILESCAEQFMKKYTGNDALSVSVVPGVPDNVLYVTGEKTNITPLRISKFDELSANPIYFNYYQEALANSLKFETDMWNPHIGFNLQRRGFLPYMNPEMETKCDEELVKALFYALTNNLITYREKRGNIRGSFRLLAGGNDKILLSPEGKIIDKNNQAQLMSWLRIQDEFVKEWSAAFDRDIETQKRNLPMIITDSQRSRLEMMLSRSPFTKMLRNSFFTDLSKTRSAEGDNEGGIGVLEFAFGVKSSEESSRDCNDAERILSVAYKIFLELIEYRINRDNNPALFYSVYMQQLEELFVALAKGSTVSREKKNSQNPENAIAMYNHIVSWVNDSDAFMAIPETLFSEDGQLLIDEPFRATPKVLAELNRVSAVEETADESAE